MVTANGFYRWMGVPVLLTRHSSTMSLTLFTSASVVWVLLLAASCLDNVFVDALRRYLESHAVDLTVQKSAKFRIRS
jgi:hypothetical protein